MLFVALLLLTKNILQGELLICRDEFKAEINAFRDELRTEINAVKDKSIIALFVMSAFIITILGG